MSGYINEIHELNFNFVCGLLLSGYDILLGVRGSSMFPFLRDSKDRVLIRGCEKDDVKIGDIVFFKRSCGKYVMHRVVAIDAQKNVYLAGDAQCNIEGPVYDIFGKVVKIYRGSKCFNESLYIWKILSCVWIKIIFLRKPLLKIFYHFKIFF